MKMHDLSLAKARDGAGAPRGVLTDRRALWLCLAAAIAAHLALHILPALSRMNILHDEGITLLSVTGHQAGFTQMTDARTPPYGAWVAAEEWKRLLRPEPGEGLLLGKIAGDLSHYDIHPPLYFWAARLAILAFGGGLRAALLLNLVFDILAIGAVALLAREALRSERWAGVAALLWSLSPGPLSASLEARQYSLFGLLASLFFWQSLKAVDPERRFGAGQAGVLAALCALGLLSHFYFAIAMAGAALLALRRLWPQSRARLFAIIAALAAGAAVFLLVHPGVLRSVERQESQMDPFRWAGLGVRLLALLSAPSNFFLAGVMPLRVAWVVATFAAAIGAVIVRRRSGRWPFQGLSIPLGTELRAALFLLLFTFVASVLPFLAFVTHLGTIKAKYFCMIYPLAACALAAILRAANARASHLAVLAAVMGTSSAWLSIDALFGARAIRSSLPIAEGADRIVLDTAARGVVPVILWNVPDRTLVYIAWQGDLIRASEAWTKPLTGSSLVITDPERWSAEKRAALRALIEPRFDVDERDIAIFKDRITMRLREARKDGSPESSSERPRAQ